MKQNESGEELNKRHKAVNGQKEICSKPFLLYAFILLFWKREFLKKNNQESYVLVVYEELFSLGFVSQLHMLWCAIEIGEDGGEGGGGEQWVDERCFGHYMPWPLVECSRSGRTNEMKLDYTAKGGHGRRGMATGDEHKTC